MRFSERLLQRVRRAAIASAAAAALIIAACSISGPIGASIEVQGGLRIVERLPQESALQLAWSPDGRYLAVDTGSSGYVVWDIQDGRKVRELRDAAWTNVGGGHGLAFTSDGKHLVIERAAAADVRTSDGAKAALGIWNIENGALDALLPASPTLGGVGVLKFAVSHVAQQLAVLYADNRVTIFDMQTWRPVHTWFGAPANALAIDASGRMVALGSILGDGRREPARGVIWLYDTERGQIIRTIDSAHRYQVRHLAFLGDGGRLASAANQNLGPDAAVRIWDVPSGRELNAFAAGALDAFSLSVSATGSIVGLAGGGDVSRDASQFWVWELGGTGEGRALGTLADRAAHFAASALTPDGRYAAVSHVRNRGGGFEVLILAIDSTTGR